MGNKRRGDTDAPAAADDERTGADERYSSPPCLLGELDAAGAGYLTRAERITLWQTVLATAVARRCQPLARLARQALSAYGVDARAGAQDALCWSSLQNALADALLRLPDGAELDAACAMHEHVQASHADPP